MLFNIILKQTEIGALAEEFNIFSLAAQIAAVRYGEVFIPRGTGMTRINRNLSLRGIGHALHALLLMIEQIFTDPGAQGLDKAPEHGEAMIVSPSNINKPQINADKRRFVISTHREERKAKVVFQNGLIGSTGCVLSYNFVHTAVMEPNSK